MGKPWRSYMKAIGFVWEFYGIHVAIGFLIENHWISSLNPQDLKAIRFLMEIHSSHWTTMVKAMRYLLQSSNRILT